MRGLYNTRRKSQEEIPEIVTTAVSQKGIALRCATEELRGDREIVMTAVLPKLACSGICHRGVERRLRDSNGSSFSGSLQALGYATERAEK